MASTSFPGAMWGNTPYLSGMSNVVYQWSDDSDGHLLHETARSVSLRNIETSSRPQS
jgi:hypothetical protein